MKELITEYKKESDEIRDKIMVDEVRLSNAYFDIDIERVELVTLELKRGYQALIQTRDILVKHLIKEL